MPTKITTEEFAKIVKEKRPELRRLTDNEAVDIVIEEYPTYKLRLSDYKQKEGRIKEALTDIKEVGTGIKEDILSRGDKLNEILDAQAAGEQGFGSSVLQAGTTFLGAVGDVVGRGVVGAGKLLTSQKTEDRLRSTIEGAAVKIIEIPEVQQFVQDYEVLKKEDPVKARNAVALAEGGEFLLNFVGLKLATQGTRAATQGTRAAFQGARRGLVSAGRTTTEAVREGTERLIRDASEPLARVRQAVAPLETIPGRIRTNIQSAKETEKSIRGLPIKEAQIAVRDGVDIADTRAISNIVPKNKKIAKELFDQVRKLSGGDKKANPIEVVGRPMVNGIKKLESLRKSIGAKLGAVADKLGTVTKKEATDKIFTRLRNVPGLGELTLNDKGLLNFRNTVLTTIETARDRKVIQSIFTQATKGGSGKQKHLLRQELFEKLRGAKRSLQEITDTQEKAFEAIRRGLADLLETKSSSYKKLNKEFAKVADPLTDLRKIMKDLGVDEDLLKIKAGLLARRLTSNAPSNPQIRAILRKMDDVLRGKIGIEGKMEEIQELYNILNRYYDIAGGTTFQGLTTAGIERARGVGELISDRVRGLLGQTDEVKQKALEDLINKLLK